MAVNTKTAVMTKLQARLSPRWIAALVVVILAFLLPTIIHNDYYIRVAITMCIWGVLCVGFRLMFLAGEMNVGLPAFMAIGAYSGALLMVKAHWNWWLAVLVAAAMPAVVALILGRIVLRVKGAYFAILNFGFLMVVRHVWLAWPKWFGGGAGISNIPSPNAIGGWHFGSLPSFFYLGLCLLVLTIIVFYRLEKSKYGLTMKAMGQADMLTEAVGVNIMRYKLAAFVLCALFSGVVGCYFASVQHFIDPEEFTFLPSLYLVLYPVVGGLMSFRGPIWGVVFLMALPIGLKEIPGYDPKIEPIIFGSILVVVMLFLPSGLVSLPARAMALYNKLRKVRPKEVEEYAAP